jgi:hypothetical protein
MNLYPQKKTHSKGCRNGKVCYFPHFLFSTCSVFPHSPTRIEESLPTDITWTWWELGKPQEGQRHLESPGRRLTSHSVSQEKRLVPMKAEAEWRRPAETHGRGEFTPDQPNRLVTRCLCSKFSTHCQNETVQAYLILAERGFSHIIYENPF